MFIPGKSLGKPIDRADHLDDVSAALVRAETRASDAEARDAAYVQTVVSTLNKVDRFVEENCRVANFPAPTNQTPSVKTPPVVKKMRGRPPSSLQASHEELLEKKLKVAKYQAAYRLKNKQKILGYRQEYKKLKEGEACDHIESSIRKISKKKRVKQLNKIIRPADTVDSDIHSSAFLSLVTVATEMEEHEAECLKYKRDYMLSKSTTVQEQYKVDCSEADSGCDFQIPSLMWNDTLRKFESTLITGYVESTDPDAGTVNIRPISYVDKIGNCLRDVPISLMRDSYILNENLIKSGNILCVRAQRQGEIICVTERYKAVSFGKEIKALKEQCFASIQLGCLMLNLGNSHVQDMDILQDMEMCVVAQSYPEDGNISKATAHATLEEMALIVKYTYLSYVDGNKYPMLITRFTAVSPAHFREINQIKSKNEAPGGTLTLTEHLQLKKIIDMLYEGFELNPKQIKDYIKDFSHIPTQRKYYAKPAWVDELHSYLKSGGGL